MSGSAPATPPGDSAPTRKVALVTGGARGIGHACTLHLAERGYDVAIADLIDPVDTARAVRSAGARALPIVCDVGVPSDVTRTMKAIEDLFERELDAVLPTLAGLDVTELPYASLAGGFLTGKYGPGIAVDSARAGRASAHLGDAKNLALLRELDAIAASHEVSVTAVSLAWLRQHPGIGAPIASAGNVDQLDQLIESFGLELTPAELQALAALPTQSSSARPYFGGHTQ